jgi:hypothetical protein
MDVRVVQQDCSAKGDVGGSRNDCGLSLCQQCV